MVAIVVAVAIAAVVVVIIVTVVNSIRSNFNIMSSKSNDTTQSVLLTQQILIMCACVLARCAWIVMLLPFFPRSIYFELFIARCQCVWRVCARSFVITVYRSFVRSFVHSHLWTCHFFKLCCWSGTVCQCRYSCHCHCHRYYQPFRTLQTRTFILNDVLLAATPISIALIYLSHQHCGVFHRFSHKIRNEWVEINWFICGVACSFRL